MISYLHKILTNNKVTDVLDLGAGAGTESLYCASFGAHVDWVDKKEPPKYLNSHPHINTIQTDIKDFKFDKEYDLIILKFILHFLNKEFIISILFPHVIKSLRPGGFLIISAFGEKDMIFSLPERSIFFSKEELENQLRPLILKDYEEYDKKDSHPPLGEHTHAIQLSIFEKENSKHEYSGRAGK